MTWLSVALTVAGVGFLLMRRVVGNLLEVRRLLVLPVVLGVIGINALHHPTSTSAAAIAFLALSFVVSIVLGLARGRTVHLGERDGAVWMRYTAASVGLWLLNFVIKIVMYPVEHAVSPAVSGTVVQGLLLSFALGVLAESAVVLLRAMRTTSVVAWRRGSDGAPHPTSPGLERARQWLTASPSANGDAVTTGRESFADTVRRLTDRRW